MTVRTNGRRRLQAVWPILAAVFAVLGGTTTPASAAAGSQADGIPVIAYAYDAPCASMTPTVNTCPDATGTRSGLRTSPTVVRRASGYRRAAKAADDVGEYLAKKAPRQVAPGTRNLKGVHKNDQGRVEPWTAHYDEHGRLVGRTDYNAGNQAKGIPDTHHHRYEYGPGYGNGREVESHVPGEYAP